MKNIQLLDCTLRDGGYCNQWEFGYNNSIQIVNALEEAKINIIECGFISSNVSFNENITKFPTIEDVSKIIKKKKEGVLYVAMINFGEYDVNNLPNNDETFIDGIRVAFHKKDVRKALNVCEIIKNKGYKVFVQPMVSLSYSDIDFIELINQVNKLKPYAFYIVDSFGVMKNKDVKRFFYLIENNLDKDVSIGFHSHNNLQLAYSNAVTIVGMHTERKMIIDCSVLGMGRGAGNLNTELFIEYLNDNFDAEYLIKPLLKVIDEVINLFYQKKYWGYSLPNYISAVNNIHPNYASFLTEKNTLTIENINDILSGIKDEYKCNYDKNYIEHLYFEYMTHCKCDLNEMDIIKENLYGKEICLIAPGRNSAIQRERIEKLKSKDNIVFMSVNYKYKYIDLDYIFVSNIRRYNDIKKKKEDKLIVTSNIEKLKDDDDVVVDYSNLLNKKENVHDNAGLMAIKFLIDCRVSKIFMAGFDGYSHNLEENYGDNDLNLVTCRELLDKMNIEISEVLREFAKEVSIEFVTDSKYLL